MSAAQYTYDWADLAFGSKKPLSSLKATFITMTREISEARFKEILKQYILRGPVVLGFPKEAYVDGFELQSQFKTARYETFASIIEQANARLTHKTYILHYAQKDLVHILPKLHVKHAVFMRGSWLHTFHTTPIYYTLMQNNISYDLISPFTDEPEAKQYAKRLQKKISQATALPETIPVDERVVQEYLKVVASRSFDYSFQTGLLLLRKQKDSYEVLTSAHNKVVPFETYAMHFGAAREMNFSPPHDLNHYDTVHAEVEMLIEAQKQKLDLKGSTVFLNLMPCPTCTRMLCDTDIAEVIYLHDHSDGYALKLLTEAGKKVRRSVLA